MAKKSRILQGAYEALDFAKGEADPKEFSVHIPEEVDVKGIRERLHMTQHQFASAFGFSLSAVRHWEQQRRKPEGAARAYLMVIAKQPDVVREALRS